MRKLLFRLALISCWSAFGQNRPAQITTLDAAHSLTNEQAKQHLAVNIEAVVTFYDRSRGSLFVEEGNNAIFVQAPLELGLAPGDRVRVQGSTHESFRPAIIASSVNLRSHGPLPKPIPATFDDMIHARIDSRFATVRGKVLSADVASTETGTRTILQLRTDGGRIRVEINGEEPAVFCGMLDADVEISGAVAGRFDGKMQMTGIILYAQDFRFLKILKTPAADPWTLPLTPMDQVLSGYRVAEHTQRVRVQGIITYYQPGTAVVLQDGPKSLWISTSSRDNLRVGDRADATGFPSVHSGFLTLKLSELSDARIAAPIIPQPVSAGELMQSHHVFDLVSVEGVVMAQVREARQDRYILSADGHLFTAILSHSAETRSGGGLPSMRQVTLGSRVRISGICIMEDANPFGASVPFDVLMRSSNDLVVVAHPSWISIDNLARIVSILLFLVLATAGWGWVLSRKVHRQAASLARKIEAEAALERHNVQIEQRRSRILEEINSDRPLSELLEEITELVSFHLNGAPCWCEMKDGTQLGQFQPEAHGRRLLCENIQSRSGPSHGKICAAVELGTSPSGLQKHALVLGSRLATLAIETRRTHSDLVRRSEFDVLTNTHNRFSLHRELDKLFESAAHDEAQFAIIYVDLNDFKQVNDVYGHLVGDLYLQEAARRMKKQLRAADLLARMGGDEFVALIPAAHSRNEVMDIAARLEHCFDMPLTMGSVTLKGSASIGAAVYPEDGRTKHDLLRAADAEMYVHKRIAHQNAARGEDLSTAAKSS